MILIRFLRAILNFVFLFAALSAGASLFYYFIASQEIGMTFNVGGNLIGNYHWTFYVVLSAAIVSQFVFVYMIFHLKKAAWMLSPRKMFDKEISRRLNLAGFACVVGTLLNRVPSFIYRFSFISERTSTLGYQDSALNFGFSFDSMLVTITFGIFLIICARYIKLAAVFKQENDLTI